MGDVCRHENWKRGEEMCLDCWATRREIVAGEVPTLLQVAERKDAAAKMVAGPWAGTLLAVPILAGQLVSEAARNAARYARLRRIAMLEATEADLEWMDADARAAYKERVDKRGRGRRTGTTPLHGKPINDDGHIQFFRKTPIIWVDELPIDEADAPAIVEEGP